MPASSTADDIASTQSADPAVRAEIAASARPLPEPVLAVLAYDPVPEVVDALIGSTRPLPESVVRALATFEDPGDAYGRFVALARSPQPLPEDVVRLLAAAPWARVRYTLLGSPRPLPDDVVLNLAAESNLDVIEAVAERLGLPDNLVREVEFDVSIDVLGQGEFPADGPERQYNWFVHLTADDASPLHRAVAATWTRVPALLTRLADDDSPTVRVAVVRNPAADDALLSRLADDSDGKVRRAVQQRLVSAATT